MTDLKALLLEEIRLLGNAAEVLKYSLDQCYLIGSKETYTTEELTEFEALTARFSRLSDLLIKKAFRALDEYELEEPGTIRDRINRAEKRNVVQNTEDLVKIRILRNEIVHEYLPEELNGLFAEVMLIAPVLLEIASRTVAYAKTTLGER